MNSLGGSQNLDQFGTISPETNEETHKLVHSSEISLTKRSCPVRKSKIKNEKNENYEIPYLRKGRQDLPLKEKIKILKLLEKDPRTPQRVIATTFKVSQSQISRISNNKDKITKAWQNGNADRKRNRKGKCGLVEQKLLEWYHEAKQEGLPVSGPTLMEKARSIGEELNLNFTPTTGWFGRWKNRNGVALKVTKNQDGSVSYSKISSHWRRYTFTKVLRDNVEENIWFLDTLRLLSNLLPSDIDASPNIGEKGMMTVLFAFNYLGSRRNPMVIGSEVAPSHFAELDYHQQSEGTLTEDHVNKWLRKWDKALKAEKRKITLFLRKASYINENVNLHSISLQFFPEGDVVSLRLQPFQFGISKSFRTLYRTQIAVNYNSFEVCRKLNSQTDTIPKDHFPPLSVLTRLHMIRRAWKHIHPDIFAKAIVKAGLSKQVQCLDVDGEVGPPLGMEKEEFSKFVTIEDHYFSNRSEMTEETNINSATSVHKEISNSEALLACKTLREYLERNRNDFVDRLAVIESDLQFKVLKEFDPSHEVCCVDPFHDPKSIYNLERHSCSVLRHEALEGTDSLELSETEIVQNEEAISNTNQISNENVSLGYPAPKYPDNYSNPTSSQDILLHPQLPSQNYDDSLKNNCHVSPLNATQPIVGQYQTSTNGYISQNVELKSIPIGIPRTLSEINLDRFTLHPEVTSHARSVNDMGHIIPATQLTNQTPTFITFASPF